MQIGVHVLVHDAAIDLGALGAVVENAGFESLWFPEHTHSPVDGVTAREREGGRLRGTLLDPLIAATAVAARTSRLRVGTAVCLVMQHDPITLAKTVASVDAVASGRFLFGVGGGWHTGEMANHGTRPALRWRILRERMLAMRRIWTDQPAEYHGRFVDFAPLWSGPPGVHRRHPPVLVGGDGPGTLACVVEYGDGWFPHARPGPAYLAARIGELQRLAAAAGRGPLPVSVFGVPVDAEQIARFAQIGVERCVLTLPAGTQATLHSEIERYARIVAPFLGSSTHDV